MARSSLSLCVVVACFIVTTNALDENSAKEQPCFNISKVVPLDLSWISSIKTLYYPLMSKLKLYRIAADLGKDINELTESSLKASCIYWNLPNGTFVSRGFDGQSRVYLTKPLSPNLEKFEISPKEGEGFSGLVHVTMTDNKTFFFVSVCTTDGEMVWGVGSTIPSLPKETLIKVLNHAKELGFKQEYITGLKYENCNI